MRKITSPSDMLNFAFGEKKKGKKIGFVPTMGALHLGHMALLQQAVHDNDVVVASIFINPLQFNNPEDFNNYPQTQRLDLDMLEGKGCDVIFLPTKESLFENPPVIKMDFGNLEMVMEGLYRPGHFNGVGIIVSKLFNLVQPDRAYFGLKDLQQFLVIKTLVRDLSMDVEVIPVPTLREPSGLALSSRNLRLSEEGKNRAALLQTSINMVIQELRKGIPVNEALDKGKNLLKREGQIELEYLELGNMLDLGKVEKLMVGESYALCGAVYIEGVRLIDNSIFEAGF